jgi:ribosome-associated translation inhibitor RaiA
MADNLGVTEPPREGVHRQDQLERFSTHISTIPYIEVQVKVITALVHVLIIQKRFEAKITLQRINQSLRK